jgi:hypothetical protein
VIEIFESWRLVGPTCFTGLLVIHGLIRLAVMQERRRAYRDVLREISPGTMLIDRSGSRRELMVVRLPSSSAGGPGDGACYE